MVVSGKGCGVPCLGEGGWSVAGLSGWSCVVGIDMGWSGVKGW